MGLFDQFPYTNFHELNLDWVLQALKELEHTIEQFVAINALKYANPIQWDITSQYEKNTIVIDPQTGTAYISVQAVPSGVALTDTDYWTVIFNLEQFVTKANNNFTVRVEEQTTLNATFPTNTGSWLVWNGVLYEALSNIIAGDQYIEDSNIKRITVEEITGDLVNLNTTDKSNLVAAINEILSTLNSTTGDLANLNTIDKSNLVAAINEVISNISTIAGAVSTNTNNIGDLTSLNTTDKSNLVAAINEVLDNAGIYNNSTPDSGLTTNIGLKEGVYNVTSDLTINAQLVLPKGAVINVPTGVTLTINGQILAGRYQIFTGDGNIVVNNAYQDFGYPEWFGAVVNNNTVDNSIYINKCLSIFTNTVLSDGIYYVANTVVMSIPSTNIAGAGQWWGSKGTCIKTSINTISPVFRLGFDTAPGAINDFCNSNKIEHLTISGYGPDFLNNSIALQISYALRGYLNDVQCRDASICLLNKCTVAIKIFKCDFFSTLLSTGDNTRTCDLLRIYNSSDELNVGASASLQIINSHFSIGGVAYAQSYGIRAFGARFSDLMITGCEINSVYNGLVLVGNNDRTGTLDILISNNVIDSVVLPVNFANMAFGMINFVNNYMAGTAATTTLLTMQTCVNIKIADCHFVGYSSDNCHGITVSSCTSLQLIDNSFYEVSNCILLAGACLYSKFSGNAYISQNTGTSIISGAQLTNSEIDFRTEGSFNAGISITSMTKCSVDFTGFSAVTPLTIGGVAVTPTNGYNVATDNYYSGVMSA